MVKSNYIPQKGDIVWLEFNPQSGHEQKGTRPALVISPEIYNSKTGLCLFMPITSKVKDYPFEVKVKTPKISGVILSDQIKSLDFKARNIKFIDRLEEKAFNQAIEKVLLLIEKM